MDGLFTTRVDPIIIDCPQPVLTIGFPTNIQAGPGDVVLANGAVVNLVALGQILSNTCPAFICPGAAPLPLPGPTTGLPQAPIVGSPAIQLAPDQLAAGGVDPLAGFVG